MDFPRLGQAAVIIGTIITLKVVVALAINGTLI